VRRIVLVTMVVAFAACSSQDAPPPAAGSSNSAATTPPDRRTLPAVTLPDLSRTSASVQQQLKSAYALLTTAIQTPTTTDIDLASAYGTMGKLFMAAEFFEQAEPCFLDAQHLSPDELRWSYFLAHVYRLEGKPVPATKSFERVLALRSDMVAAMVWLADLYIDQDQPARADALYAKALTLQPQVVAAHVGRGRAALVRRDYTGAVQYFESALALNPRATIVHYPLAMAYRGLGKSAEADMHLRLRGDVEIPPPDPLMLEVADLLQSAVVYENRGDRALARQEFGGAAALFRKGLELAPDHLALRHRLATALSLSGDVPGAVAQFQEVLRRAPTFAEAHYSLGVLLLSNGREDLAIERFSEAVRNDPTYLQARLQLAHALRRRGRAGPALRQYEEVIQLDPRVAEARFGAALSLVRLKRYQEARDTLLEGSKMHIDRVEFTIALARLLAAAPDAQVRDGRLAVDLLQDLAKRSPATDVREAMAMALAEVGQYADAIAWQREAINAAEQAGQSEQGRRLAENLRLYERHTPCRNPWANEPVWTNE
jgi:tetratricopeptide (TPR) repeat protein